MRCLYCDKKLSLLKLAKGDSFCSPEHFDAYQFQMSKTDIERLMGMPPTDYSKLPVILATREEPAAPREAAPEPIDRTSIQTEEPVQEEPVQAEPVPMDPPYAAFAKPLLPAYPPAAAPAIAEEPDAPIAPLSFPVPDVAVTSGVLNLILQTNLSELSPLDWAPTHEQVVEPEELRPVVSQPAHEAVPESLTLESQAECEAAVVEEPEPAALPRLPFLVAPLFGQRTGPAIDSLHPITNCEIPSPAVRLGELPARATAPVNGWHVATGPIGGWAPGALDVSHRATEAAGFTLPESQTLLVRHDGPVAEVLSEARSIAVGSQVPAALKTTAAGGDVVFVNPPPCEMEFGWRPILAGAVQPPPFSSHGWRNANQSLSLPFSVSRGGENSSFPIAAPLQEVHSASSGTVNLPRAANVPPGSTRIGLGAPLVTWNPRISISPEGPPAKFLSLRRGPALPPAASWPRLGPLPR